MRWQGGRRSEHVEDRRGSRPGLAPAGVGSLGIGGIVLLMAITYVMGGDPLAILTSTDHFSPAPAGAVASVQNLLGVAGRVDGARRRLSEVEANALSVRQELQADCFAGVWGFHAASRNLLEPGDVEEGLAAAAAIGDDRLQRLGQNEITPETWTHGSSAQRVQWLRRGLESGRLDRCDTFSAGS